MKRPYYLFSNGRLRRKQNTIFFEKTNDERIPDDLASDTALPSSQETLGKVPIPVEQIEALYCFGEMDINSKLVTFLAQNRIPLYFYDYYGNFTATLIPRNYLLSGKLKVAQVQHYLSPKKRIHLAQVFVQAAAFNILRVLKYYATRLPEADAKGLQQQIDKIIPHQASIQNTTHIPQLMGIEGNIRHLYYQSWHYILGDKIFDFPFHERSKNPPSNEMNALISFGNSLCYSSVIRQIYRTALDPTISFLHEPGERRFSLALDLAEVFKPLLVDRAIFRLVKTGTLQPKHFEKRLGGVYLKDSGRKIFVEHWDERLRQTIEHRGLKRKVSYERLVRLECYKLTRFLLDPKNEPYEGFKMWW